MESEKKYGIEALKKAVDFAAKMHMAVDMALQDKKIDLNDAQYLLAPGMALIPALGVIGQLPKEFGDLDETEKGELKQYAMDTYSLTDKKAERVVEKAFGLLVEIGDLVEDVVSGDDQ